MDVLWSWIVLGGLAAARSLPVAFLVPAFGGQTVPARIRVGFALALALITVPQAAVATTPTEPVLIMLLMMRELLVGVTLGFLASLTFRAAEMAGQLIDIVRGANMSEVLAPLSGERSSPTGLLFQLLVTVVFLELGGMGHLAAAMGRSYEAVPLGFAASGTASVGNPQLLVQTVIVTMARLFESALGLAAPVIVAVLLADVILGLVARSVPQIPVYFIGLPLKGLAAVGVVLLSLGTVEAALAGNFAHLPGILLRSLEIWR